MAGRRWVRYREGVVGRAGATILGIVQHFTVAELPTELSVKDQVTGETTKKYRFELNTEVTP